MKVSLLVIGKTEESYIREGLSEYAARVKRYTPFEIREIPALRDAKSMPQSEQKKREAVLIMKQISDQDIVVLLDEHGPEMRSVKFAAFLNSRFSSGGKSLVFVVGGPFGFGDALRQRADHLLSLSKMTFSHQMVRLIFAEQLYRALTILKNESYHHE